MTYDSSDYFAVINSSGRFDRLVNSNRLDKLDRLEDADHRIDVFPHPYPSKTQYKKYECTLMQLLT